MWYFAWILGLGLAVCLGVINVMWLEADYAFGSRDEETTRLRFEKSQHHAKKQPDYDQKQRF